MAVAYDTDVGCHVGELLEKASEKEYKVKFMRIQRGGARWPKEDVIEQVLTNFILKESPLLVSRDSQLRKFEVKDRTQIQDAYGVYAERYLCR